MDFHPDTLSRRQIDILHLLADREEETADLIQVIQRIYADPPPEQKIREDLHILLEGGYLAMEGVEDRRAWHVTQDGERWLEQRQEWEDEISESVW